jgi:malate dehydrogenase (oxaloacetate-decarboxylating)(NADP+)
VNGAGAAAIACVELYIALRCKKENFMMFDSKGLIHKDRTDLDERKKKFLSDGKDLSLAEAMKNAMFLSDSVRAVY